MNLKVRASEAYNLMVKPRSKSETLSETTKSWLKEKVKQEVFSYIPTIENKYMIKGIRCEDTSIALLNEVENEWYEKNTERFYYEDWLSGEPDIITSDVIRDVKTSWSLETFPAFKEDAEKSIKAAGYEWQLRCYMLLVGRERASIDYCMVSTPEDEDLLKPWDNLSIHKVDNIPAKQRVNTVWFERDKKLEEELIERYKLANSYYLERLNELVN